MTTHSLAQQRALHALQVVSELEQKGPQHYGNYLGYVKALPANVRSLGLGQALAFLLAKAEGDLNKPHGQLYKTVTAWLCTRPIYIDATPQATPQNFMENLTQGTQDQYLHAQIETMAYLEWLKKFAVAKLKKQEGDEE